MKNNSEQYKRELIEIFSKISGDKKLIAEFLVDILTPAEFEALALRWQIVTKLHKGESQRSIAEDLSIGVGTVTRGARELRDTKGGFQLILKKLGK